MGGNILFLIAFVIALVYYGGEAILSLLPWWLPLAIVGGYVVLLIWGWLEDLDTDLVTRCFYRIGQFVVRNIVRILVGFTTLIGGWVILHFFLVGSQHFLFSVYIWFKVWFLGMVWWSLS